MHTKTLISIIVLAYNRPKLTRQTLETLQLTLQLTELDYEVIVVDNESDAETSDTIRSFKDFTSIRINKNVGIGAGKNIGVEAAGGSYLYISDNDMYFLYGWLDSLLTAAQAFPTAKIIGAYRHQLHRKMTTHQVGEVSFQQADQQVGNSWFLSRETWKHYGPLLEGVETGIDDVAFCNAVMRDGYMVGSILPHRVIHCGVYTSSGTLVPEAQKLWSTDELSIDILPKGLLLG